MQGGFLILDFGSQYTQLIARRLRELEYYSEIALFDLSIEEIKKRKPDGIILSGGPQSVFSHESHKRDLDELRDVAPLLGLCYGMQWMAHFYKGEVVTSDAREYGRMNVHWDKSSSLDFTAEFDNNTQSVWMSHGDVIQKAPDKFSVIGKSESGHIAAFQSKHETNKCLGFQFHPEVAHTEKGEVLLKYFCQTICKSEPSWTAPSLNKTLVAQLKEQVPHGEKILCALSGGVDSSVVATLLTQTFGKENVKCVFVDTGLLRKNEFENVMSAYSELNLDVTGVNAKDLFYDKLKDVTDPEAKRKIIGGLFIDVFKEEIKKLGKIDYLAQGTLYPDVIESVSLRGTNVTIKSHHNVGGLPKDLNLKLVEPLRLLFKDEVRALGREIGLPEKFVARHPFPGPGLAIRILGEVTEERVRIVQEADFIFIDELRKNDLYNKIWQAYVALLPVRSVGVQGDGRTYDQACVLRAVTSSDGMTADWYNFEPKFLAYVSNRITNEVKGINRVVYDITSKPPGTIEWE